MSEDFNKSEQISDHFFKQNTKPDFSIKDIKQEKAQRTILFNMKVARAKKSNLRFLKNVFEEFYRTHGGQLKRDIEKSVALEKHEVEIKLISHRTSKRKLMELQNEIIKLEKSTPKLDISESILKMKIRERNNLDKKLALSDLGHFISNDKSEKNIYVKEIEKHENLSASDGLSSKVIAPAIRKEETLLLFQTYMKAKIPGLKQVCLKITKDEETGVTSKYLVLSW